MIKIGNNISEFSVYSCQPKNRKELKDLIDKRVIKEGSKCDLNDIDVSLVTDMSYLFYTSGFNGDISEWNVSNVNNMNAMFAYSFFKGDISKWDVINVNDMGCMFSNSKFNRDISKWKINKNCDTTNMFKDCPIKDEYKPELPR